LKDGAVDTGCGLKVFYREAFLRLPAFDHMHRYLPALMRREGFAVEFAGVGHRPRAHGRSKYTNLGRLAVSLRDLMGVMWLNARARSPREISEL
jgi:dolichol-phosphate mannosyltransferase